MQYCELALHLALEIFAHVTVQFIPPTLCIAHVICEGELVVQVQTEDMEVQGSLAALAPVSYTHLTLPTICSV